MKVIISSLLFICFTLCGCSITEKSSITKGRDFDETKVSQIKKGVTTADGVVKLFGEPDSKVIESANQVMWHYTYLSEVHTTPTVTWSATWEKTAGFKKNLDILLQDNIVINFAYVNAPIQSENTR